MLSQRWAQGLQRFVLCSGKRVALQPLQLYADGVVIAVVTAPVVGGASVPGTVIATDKLPDFSAALDVEMRGHLQALNTFEIRVL